MNSEAYSVYHKNVSQKYVAIAGNNRATTKTNIKNCDAWTS